MKSLLLRLFAAAISFVISLAWTFTAAFFLNGARDNETKAVTHIQAIGRAQLIYSVTKGRGKFTDLETLGREGLLDAKLASGVKDGYMFSSVAYHRNDAPAMFNIMAHPQPPSFLFKAGEYSFYSNETMVIYQRKDAEPPIATFSDRVPKNAEPL